MERRERSIYKGVSGSSIEDSSGKPFFENGVSVNTHGALN